MKITKCLLLLSLLFFLSGCESESNSNAEPRYIEFNNPQALFISSEDLGTSRSRGTESVLYEIQENQDFVEVLFYNSENEKTDVSVHIIKRISEDLIYIYCSTHVDNDDRAYSIIADITDGTAYDLGFQQMGVIYKRNENLYLTGLTGPNIVNMETGEIIPLTNEEYFETGSFTGSNYIKESSLGFGSDIIPFILTEESDLITNGKSNIESSYSYYQIDSAGINPPQKLNSSLSSTLDEIKERIENSLLCFYDENRNLNILSIWWDTPYQEPDEEDTGMELIHYIYHIENETITLISEVSHGSYDLGRLFQYSLASDWNQNSNTFIFTDGIVEVTKPESGILGTEIEEKEIIPQSVSEDLYITDNNPMHGLIPIENNEGLIRFSGNSLFFRDGNTIYKSSGLSETEHTEIAGFENIADWNIVDGILVISLYTSATNVVTYKVEEDGTLTEISDSTVAILSIIEM